MPELPELQAHAERLDERYAGTTLERFTPLTFTALKTAVPPASRRAATRPGFGTADEASTCCSTSTR